MDDIHDAVAQGIPNFRLRDRQQLTLRLRNQSPRPGCILILHDGVDSHILTRFEVDFLLHYGHDSFQDDIECISIVVLVEYNLA